jgi:tetrachlorobenzoquinone reductase
MMNEQTVGAAADSTRKQEARVRTLRQEAERVLSVELVPLEGEDFLPFTPGAHIDLHLTPELTRSYSLVNAPEERNRYVVSVLNDKSSRGGSRYVHEQLRCGATLFVSKPRNNFELDDAARSTLLIAGGIGVTPLLCMYRRLREKRCNVTFVYCARSRGQAAYLDELATLGGDIHLHFDDEHDGHPCDLVAFLARQPEGVHAYCCGPGPMLIAFEAACGATGIKHVHVERFEAEPGLAVARHAGYKVELARSGRTLFVPAGKTLLDALIEANVDVDYSCREGLCGACQTRVLGGCPDHCDSVLTQSERAVGNVMMICVSGALSDSLVLDLA